MKRSFFLATILLAAHVQAQDEAPTAQTLLQKMAETYAAVLSYSDTTIANYRQPDGAPGAQAEAKIWFVRPDLFRIDGQSKRAAEALPKREVMWSDGETARAWTPASAVTMLPKIQLAGSKMFGTYAYHIPTLLQASFGGPRRLHQLESPTVVAEETIDDIACYRIKGDWQGDPYEVWLGKVDSLVHKLSADYKGYAMEELHRDIRLNAPISKDVFDFAPENENVSPSSKSTPQPTASPWLPPARRRTPR